MNWGEIKTAVMAYLEAGSTSFIQRLPLFARLAEEDIFREVQLPLTKVTAWNNLVMGSRFMPMPPDWLSTYSVAIKVAGDYVFLQAKDGSFLREAYPNADDLGVPRYYGIFDQSAFVVAPTPALNFDVEMQYFNKPISISVNDTDGTQADTNTNWVSQNGENAYLFGILYHGYIFEKGDQDVITAYKEQFAKAIGNLKTIAEGRGQKDTYRTPDQRITT